MVKSGPDSLERKSQKRGASQCAATGLLHAPCTVHHAPRPMHHAFGCHFPLCPASFAPQSLTGTAPPFWPSSQTDWALLLVRLAQNGPTNARPNASSLAQCSSAASQSDAPKHSARIPHSLYSAAPTAFPRGARRAAHAEFVRRSPLAERAPRGPPQPDRPAAADSGRATHTTTSARPPGAGDEDCCGPHSGQLLAAGRRTCSPQAPAALWPRWPFWAALQTPAHKRPVLAAQVCGRPRADCCRESLWAWWAQSA